MNESPPLYFLAAVPRNAGGTVAAAIDSLAPAAVHAAIARGVDVRRQGDVFFVATGYSEEELQLLGARFGRLTQWTRDAKPRPGEITYRPNPRAADRRREARIRRREWRRLFAQYQGMLADRRPSTPAGWRRKNRAERRRLQGLVASRRETLRRLLAEPFRHAPASDRYGFRVWDGRRYLGPVETSRYQYASRVRDARANVTAAERLLADAVAARMVERDRYRRGVNPPARIAMNNAALTAATRVRPWQVGDGAVWSRDRETVRRHLAVYGTAHSASRVAVLPGGATYVSGTVRHEPSLEPNRRGGRDHRPLTLEPGVWYLAVRNTVPRQNRRRTRVTA